MYVVLSMYKVLYFVSETFTTMLSSLHCTIINESVSMISSPPHICSLACFLCILPSSLCCQQTLFPEYLKILTISYIIHHTPYNTANPNLQTGNNLQFLFVFELRIYALPHKVALGIHLVNNKDINILFQSHPTTLVPP